MAGKGKSSTAVIDKGYSRIRAAIGKSGGQTAVEVGIFSGKRNKQGADILAYAMANEYGVKGHGDLDGDGWTIPPRPFIRGTVDLQEKEYKRILADGAAAITEGNTTARKVLTELGVKIVGDTKIYITTLKDPPNAPSTQLQKGRGKRLVNNPLIDTGAMRNAVVYKVVDE